MHGFPTLGSEPSNMSSEVHMASPITMKQNQHSLFVAHGGHSSSGRGEPKLDLFNLQKVIWLIQSPFIQSLWILEFLIRIWRMRLIVLPTASELKRWPATFLLSLTWVIIKHNLMSFSHLEMREIHMVISSVTQRIQKGSKCQLLVNLQGDTAIAPWLLFLLGWGLQRVQRKLFVSQHDYRAGFKDTNDLKRGKFWNV